MNSLLKKHLKNGKILTKFYQDERWFICWFGGGGDMGRGEELLRGLDSQLGKLDS